MSDTEAGAARIITARRIATGDGTEPEAFVVAGEWITQTGPVAALRAARPDATLIDLGDVTVVPGFNDAHSHPTVCAEQLLQLDLSPQRVPDRAAMLAALAERAAGTPAGEWILGFGVDPARSLGGVPLSRDELDAACPRQPVLVVDVTLHAGVLNTAGLALAGYERADDAPAGGELGHDAAGRLTGVLVDQALYDVAFPAFTRRATVVPRPDRAAAQRAFVRFAGRLHAAGITSVGDAMVGPESWATLAGLAATGELPLRVNALVGYEHWESFRAMDLPAPAPTDRLRIGGVKAFADGAVNGGVCWTKQPVPAATAPGRPRMSPAQLRQVVADVHEHGGTIAVHANGDRAIAEVLAAIEAAQRHRPRPEVRHRVEHVAIVDDQIVAAMRALRVVAVPFGQYPAAHGDKLRRFYDPDRIERMFAHRTLLAAGIPVAGSSDHPCGPYEPLYALQSLVTRRDRTGAPFGGSQAITAEQALAVYTTGSAYASGEEATKGRIAAGQLADFVALAEDPRAVPPDRIGAIEVLGTWLGGTRVYPTPAAPAAAPPR
ncbi:amidohydrolase [Actinocatenispora thailandica]|uniref:Amidohydrolase n=1 Tax=Actinocatenispora thailandica TaxID=227318 RepID=A0A7R7DQA1_9ACTN|nr:amidohydrolase [Actinocatenispora thailandica]BCJ35675.1 amidohydrolase [Actinocatenispora thailandica]